MLKRIRCTKFQQKEIIFHTGLNSVVGDDIATNSIGKTTLLMIIDFIFGGNDYITKNSDTIENLGHHEFLFSFEFADQEYYFKRSTEHPKDIIICNNNFEDINKKTVDKYCLWLQKKYNCVVEDLSFRNIIGRYFRVYGKDNLNEKRPIQYVAKEKENVSILNLIKLFNKYKPLKSCEEQLKDLQTKKKVLTDGSKTNMIPITTTKREYKFNESKITKLSLELEELKKDIVNQTVDVESLISKEVLELQSEKSRLTVQKNVLNNRLRRIKTNIENKKSKVYAELTSFTTYFPNFNVEQVNKLDEFHDNLTRILKDELTNVKKVLSDQITTLETKVNEIDLQIVRTLEIKNAPVHSVNRLIQLTTELNEIMEQNRNYKKRNELTAGINDTNSILSELKVTITDDICDQINRSMSKFIKEIYSDGRRTPNFNIHNNRYTFNTYGDTGTGTAFASLISFDLSLLKLTCLPTLIHDLPLLKNIENNALENIFKLYSRSEKQIFIAIDKLSSYSKESKNLIENSKVLQLNKDKLLFIKNWKNAN
ncbi:MULTISPECIES: DUF2326 domain-containing protein [unclassified Enterococcus]|jgi:hypothetical protein|uniref:DUF2326 domain-containing protein n=1 Tax=unclassified Enterococcus TaxID=2608891 RepID=UPI003D2BC112